MRLFGDIIEDDVEDIKYPDIPELETSEKLSKEKQVLGVYVSGHPFEKYASSFKDCSFNCLMLQNYEEDEDGRRTYPELKDGETVSMGGIIGSYKRINTRSGSTIAFVSVEDLYGSIECVAFPNVFDKIKGIVAADKVVRLTGKMQLDEEKAPVIILDKMQEYTEAGVAAEQTAAPSLRKKPAEHALWLNATALSEEEFEDFISLFAHYMNGSATVKIKRGGSLYKLNNVNDCRGLRDELYLYLDDTDIVQR